MNEGQTLDELAANYPFLLFDTSVLDKGPDIAQHVHKWRTFGDMEGDVLVRLQDGADKFHAFVHHPTIYTIQKVIDELSAYKDILRQKLDFCNNRPDAITQPKYRRGQRYNRASAQHNIPEYGALKQQFADIVFSWDRVVQRAQKRVIIPAGEQHGAFVDALSCIEDSYGVKRQFSDFYGSEQEVHDALLLQRVREDVGKSISETPLFVRSQTDTDEHLIAAALHYSIVEQRPVALVTRDLDFFHLLGIFRHVCPEQIRAQLQAYPITLLCTSPNNDDNIYFPKYDTASGSYLHPSSRLAQHSEAIDAHVPPQVSSILDAVLPRAQSPQSGL